MINTCPQVFIFFNKYLRPINTCNQETVKQHENSTVVIVLKKKTSNRRSNRRSDACKPSNKDNMSRRSGFKGNQQNRKPNWFLKLLDVIEILLKGTRANLLLARCVKMLLLNLLLVFTLHCGTGEVDSDTMNNSGISEDYVGYDR